MSDDFDDEEKKNGPPANWNVIPFTAKSDSDEEDNDSDCGEYDEYDEYVKATERGQPGEKQKSHVLEAVFDIDEGTTMVPYVEREPTVLVSYEPYDEKDNEIEKQLQEIIDYSLEAYENSSESAEDVEPQFKARNYEVAAQFLNTALSAINTKASFKQTKDKLDKLATKGGTTNNNIFVDRNELLRALNREDPIEGEFTEE